MEENEHTDTHSRLPFDDRKEHYESLISLFKYSVTILGILATFFSVTIGYMIYSDGKEMRASMNDQKDKLDQHVRELNERESEMQLRVIELMKSNSENILETSQKAIDQINQIRDEATLIARVEAGKKIDQVFDENNIEEYIIQITKNRIEPQVQNLIDNKITSINETRFKNAIKDLLSNSEVGQDRALLYFQNADPFNWTDEQLNEIVKTLKQLDKNNTYGNDVCIYVSMANSPILDNYFREELENNPSSSVGGYSFSYLLRTGNPDVVSSYIQVYKITPLDKRPNFYHRVINGSFSQTNRTLGLAFLNNKELVDMLFNDADKLKSNNRQSVKNGIDHLINTYNFLGEEERQATYFFQKEW